MVKMKFEKYKEGEVIKEDDIKCPYEKEIEDIMTQMNVSFEEAKEIYIERELKKIMGE